MRRMTATKPKHATRPSDTAAKGPSDAKLLFRRRLARWLPRHFGRTFSAFLLIALLGTAFAGTANLLNRNSRLGAMTLEGTASLGLAVESVEVEGRSMTPQKDILAAIDVARGTPILAINPMRARNRLEALPWVRAASIERRLPDTLYIKLTERQPLALWQHHGQMMLIDRDGVVVTTEDLGRFASLVLVVGDDAPVHTVDLLGMINREPALAKHVQSAVWVGGRRWDIHLDDGISVKLPEADPATAWSHLEALDRDHDLLARRIDSIDLRQPGRVVAHLVPDPPMAQSAQKTSTHHSKSIARHA